MHPQGGVTGHDADERRHAIGPSIQPTGVPPTVLVAMGDEPLLLQSWHDGRRSPAEALPLRWS